MSAVVAYYCNHEDEPRDQRTHLRDYPDSNKPKKFPAGSVDATTSRSVSFGRWNYMTQSYDPPLCPRSVPLVVATSCEACDDYGVLDGLEPCPACTKGAAS